MRVSVEDNTSNCPNWNDFLSKSVNALNPQPVKPTDIENSWNQSFSSKLSPQAIETPVSNHYGVPLEKTNDLRSVELSAALQPPKVTRFSWDNDDKPPRRLNSNSQHFESTLFDAANKLESISLNPYKPQTKLDIPPSNGDRLSWRLNVTPVSQNSVSSPHPAMLNTDGLGDFWLNETSSPQCIMESPASTYISCSSPFNVTSMTPSTISSENAPSIMGTPQYAESCTNSVFQSPIQYYTSKSPSSTPRYYPTGTPKREFRERAASTTEIPSEFYAKSRPRANSIHSEMLLSPHQSERMYPMGASPVNYGFNDTNPTQSEISGQAWYYEIEFKRYRKDIFIGVPNYKVGDYVKVEADRGYDLGHVVKASSDLNRLRIELKADGDCEVDKRLKDPLKMIQGLATPLDLNLLKRKFLEECGVLELCRNKVSQRRLPMKVIDAEFQFDRHKLTFYFEADGRIDFRELVRDLFAIYKTRIWMQQVTSDPAQQPLKSKFSK